MTRGEEFRMYRQMAGLSQQAVAKISGVSPYTIYGFETCKHGVSLTVYELLLKAVGREIKVVERKRHAGHK